jgi:hypothetical protein
MFCGWQLMFSYATLEQLGSGTLRINVLTEECFFNDTPISSLSIAATLAAWMRRELADNQIDVAALAEVSLTVQVHIRCIESHYRQTDNQYFGSNQQPLISDYYTSCAMDCRSKIVTAEKTYLSTYQDYEEWPRGWTLEA